MNLFQLKGLKSVEISFKGLLETIERRGLVDYVAQSIKEISERAGPVEERSFEGYALEALFGEQIEALGIEMKHNTSLDEYWFDIKFPAHNTFMDVKKHTSWEHQTTWLSIHRSVLEKGGQLRHLRDYGNLKKLLILFVNVHFLRTDEEGDAVVRVSPSWIVRADVFFDQLNISQNPDMRYFNHRNAIRDVDYLRFEF